MFYVNFVFGLLNSLSICAEEERNGCFTLNLFMHRWCRVGVGILCLFQVVPWVGLWSVTVVF